MSAQRLVGRAAHFLRHASLIGTPPSDAIVCAYRELGLEVDLYAPDTNASIEGLGRFRDGVTMHSFSYGKRWFARNLWSLLRKRYSVISANTENPLGIAAPLARMSRCPLIVSADEIFSGSYRGDAPERWKRFCRWGMRGARLTIVNDPSRINLQREYAALPPDRPILVYPGCFRDPPAPANREDLRAELGIPADAFVVVVSGHLTALHCGDWLIRAMRTLPRHVHLLMQPGKVDPMLLALYQALRESHRVHVVARQLTCRESWASMSCADAGFVGYLHNGPQFQNMGVSSTRLCMYLQCGLPVIALKQDSFQFLEEFRCGVLISGEDEIPCAIDAIQTDHASMSQRSREAIQRVGQMASRYAQLLNAVHELTRSRANRQG